MILRKKSSETKNKVELFGNHDERMERPTLKEKLSGHISGVEKKDPTIASDVLHQMPQNPKLKANKDVTVSEQPRTEDEKSPDEPMQEVNVQRSMSKEEIAKMNEEKIEKAEKNEIQKVDKKEEKKEVRKGEKKTFALKNFFKAQFRVSFHFSLGGLFSGGDKAYFIENLSMLLASGMNIVAALESIKQEVSSRKMKKVITQIAADIDAGIPLWKSFKATALFPEYVISLLRVGEESGKLSENLKVISVQMEKDSLFRTKVRSAMLYPTIVISLTAIIGIGVSWFILPKLSKVFSQLRMNLPLITKILISFGEFISKNGVIVVPIGVVVLLLLIYIVFVFKKTKFIGDSIIRRFPGIKKLTKEVQLARFGFVLGNLLNAGLPIVRALESLADATNVKDYKKLYHYLKEQVDEGISFQKAFANYKNIRTLIPIPIQQMIVAAEQSGRLPEALQKIGEDYEEKTEITTKNLVVVLEPIMLVVVWVGVVLVALAVILPIYNLIGGFNASRNETVRRTEPTVVEDDRSNNDKQTEDTEDTEETEDSGTPSSDTEADEETETPENVTPQEEILPKLQIKDTGTGYLNVRDKPTTSSNIIGRVKPGETYEYTDYVSGWYKIILQDATKGWVSGQYVTLIKD